MSIPTPTNAQPVEYPTTYVYGDASKTRVNIKDQPDGTRMVLVMPDGTEYDAVAGSSNPRAPLTPDQQQAYDKSKSYDPRDRKFPNLRFTRDSS